ncbi:MAG: ribose-phosphate diphosphokinase [Planctomycetota bacterium]
MDNLVVFSGNATPELAAAICKELDSGLGRVDVGRFPDGEVSVRLEEDVRGKDTFIVQSVCPPVNENLMELLILIDCVRRASADRVTAVIPYLGYARQDRRESETLVPISAKLVANLVVAAGAHRVLTMDLHTEQIQGFFDIPVDHLYAGKVFLEHFRRLQLPNLAVVSPDVGSIKMARAYAKSLGARLATVDKRRLSATETEAGFVIGDVKDCNVIIADDMIATGGSIAKAAKALRKAGALEIHVACTHPVLCGPAMETLESSPIGSIFVTDTIPIREKYVGTRVKVLSTAQVFAEAIRRIHHSSALRR